MSGGILVFLNSAHAHVIFSIARVLSMALLKFLCPIPSCSVSISEDQKHMEAEETPKKKQGNYSKFSPKDKATIRRYTSKNGVPKALRYFKEKELKESTVRDWKKAYELNLWEKRKSMEPEKAVIVSTSDGRKRGRLPLLGTKLDLILQEGIVAMRGRGTSIGSSTVIGIGRGILLKHENSSLHEFGGPITLNKDWTIGVLRRMQFTKRRANSKSKVLPSNFDETKEQFLLDIRSFVVMEDIPKLGVADQLGPDSYEDSPFFILDDGKAWH